MYSFRFCTCPDPQVFAYPAVVAHLSLCSFLDEDTSCGSAPGFCLASLQQ